MKRPWQSAGAACGALAHMPRGLTGAAQAASTTAMTLDLLTSGDLAADRRYAWGMAALAEGDAAVAADLLQQALELAPSWAPAWLALGDARDRAGLRAGAVEAWRQCLALEPEDRLGAAPRLAAAGEARSSDAISAAYVKALFDDYAPRFDGHLTEALSYRGPEVVARALDDAAAGRRFGRALDLGCGTGLTGLALRARVDWLGGCDLSPAMLARARKRAVYDLLEERDLLEVLEASTGGSLDLIVAADVLIYVSALGPVFAAAARALAPSGLMAFTTQSGEADVAVGEDLRVSHAPASVLRLAVQAGLDPVLVRDEWVRKERGRPVPASWRCCDAGDGAACALSFPWWSHAFRDKPGSTFSQHALAVHRAQAPDVPSRCSDAGRGGEPAGRLRAVVRRTRLDATPAPARAPRHRPLRAFRPSRRADRSRKTLAASCRASSTSRAFRERSG